MSTDTVTPLRHRMIEDMNARKLCAGTQRGHIHSCKRFAAFLNRSPDTARRASHQIASYCPQSAAELRSMSEQIGRLAQLNIRHAAFCT
jgi:hypothetical protein